MEELRTGSKLMYKRDFLVSIDMKDAFHLIPVHSSHQKYLMFMFQGKYYKFICLPFGLSTCPFTFTKVLKPITRILRSKGLLSVVYLDDWLIIAKTYVKCLENCQETIKLLQFLGFIINFEKCSLIPSTDCKYLGFNIDSIQGTLTLTPKKKENILTSLQDIIQRKNCKIVKFARLIGKLISACNAVQYGWLYTKDLEREKLRVLNNYQGSYRGTIIISKCIKRELTWWIKEIPHSQKCFRISQYVKTIYSDASDTGWGATDGSSKVFGFWEKDTIKLQINYKELLAVKLALEKLADKLRNCWLLLRIDNATAIAYVNKMGGTRYAHLNSLAHAIWQWAEQRGIWLKASYIPSKENTVADELSRLINPDSEWELSPKVFHNVVCNFGQPEIDIFATKLNKKCKNYISRFPDPDAWQIDSFTTNWSSFYFYAFPLFNLITKVLEKIRQEKAEGILVVPKWQNQPWYPLFVELAISKILVFKPDKKLLISLCRKKSHPRAAHLHLSAAIVSGKDSSFKTFHQSH